MRAMNDTISKFSALAFRNKRILYLSQKSDFRRYSSEIQCFWILFHQNTVILDAILLNKFLFLKLFLAQTISLKRLQKKKNTIKNPKKYYVKDN